MWFIDEWAPPMIVLRQLWDADGCGSVIVVMDRGSDGCGLVAAMEVSSSFFFFFLVLRGSSWVRLGSDRATELGGQPWSMGRSVDQRSRGPTWFVGFFGLWVVVRFGHGLQVFFLFFLAVVGGDLVRLLLIFFFFWSNGGCGCGGWMWRFFFFLFLYCCLWLRWIWLVTGGGDGGCMW